MNTLVLCIPSLVIFASGMLLNAVLAFEEFGAFNTVPLTQSGEIFCWLGTLVFSEMSGGEKICVDLIKISVASSTTMFGRSTTWEGAHLVLRFVLILRIAPIVEAVCGFDLADILQHNPT